MVQNLEKPLQEIPQYLEGLSFHESTGQLAVASSNLTGRDWDGAVTIFDDAKFAPNLPHLDYGYKTEAGAKAIEWINESRLVVSTDAGCLEILDLKERPNLENTLRLIEHGDMCSTVSVNKQTEQLLSGDYDSIIKLWDLEVDMSINTFNLHSGVVHQVKWNQNSKETFGSVSEDQHVMLYDNRKDERPALCVGKSRMYFPTCLEWLSSDEMAVGLSNGDIVFYDVRNLSEEKKSIKAHAKYITTIVENNGIIFSGSEDCYVKGHDIKLFDSVYSSKNHTDYVKCLCVNPKDNTLWSCGWAGQIFCHENTKKAQ